MAFGESGPQLSIEDAVQHMEMVEYQEPLDVQGHIDAIKKDYGIDLPVDTFDNIEQLAAISESLKQLKNNNPDARDNIQDAVQGFIKVQPKEDFAYNMTVSLEGLMSQSYDLHDKDVAVIRGYLGDELKKCLSNDMENKYGMLFSDKLDYEILQNIDRFFVKIQNTYPDKRHDVKDNMQNAINTLAEEDLGWYIYEYNDPHTGLLGYMEKDLQNGLYTFDKAIRKTRFYPVKDEISELNQKEGLESLHNEKHITLYNQISDKIKFLEDHNLTDQIFEDEFGISIQRYVILKNVFEDPESFRDTIFFGETKKSNNEQIDAILSSKDSPEYARILQDVENCLLEEYDVATEDVITEAVWESARSHYHMDARDTFDSVTHIEHAKDAVNTSLVQKKEIAMSDMSRRDAVSTVAHNAIPETMGQKVIEKSSDTFVHKAEQDFGLMSSSKEQIITSAGMENASLEEQADFVEGVLLIQQYGSLEMVPEEEKECAEHALHHYAHQLEDITHEVVVDGFQEASVGGMLQSCVGLSSKYVKIKGLPIYNQTTDTFQFAFSLPDGFEGILDISDDISMTDWSSTGEDGRSFDANAQKTIVSHTGLVTPQSILKDINIGSLVSGPASLADYRRAGEEAVARKKQQNRQKIGVSRAAIDNQFANLLAKRSLIGAHDGLKDTLAKGDKKVTMKEYQDFAMLSKWTLNKMGTIKEKIDLAETMNDIAQQMQSPYVYKNQQLMSYIGDGGMIGFLQQCSTQRKGKPMIDLPTVKRREQYIMDMKNETIQPNMPFSQYAELGGVYTLPRDVKQKITEWESHNEDDNELATLENALDTRPNNDVYLG